MPRLVCRPGVGHGVRAHLPTKSGCTWRNATGTSVIRRAGALIESGVRKAFERLDHKSDVALQLAEAAGLFQRFLVHIERAVDLDLEAVPVGRRTALPLDYFDPLIDLVDAHRVAAPPQHPGDEIGEFRGAGCSVAITQHKIRTAPALLAAALRRHRMAVHMPDRAELTVRSIASLFQHPMVGGM